jgi:hypothetical protein
LASERVERQLTAILAADVAGYSLCVPNLNTGVVVMKSAQDGK